VIFIVDPEEYFLGFPTLNRVRRWAKRLKRAGEVLRQNGIVMSINPWVTLGHGGRGYAPPKRLGFTAMMVGDDGTVSHDTACPADPAWQRYIAESYAIFASANPEILWLEDDHRLHNHGAVRFGCFAQPMLDRFAKRVGRVWNREDLVQTIVRGEGDVRKQWLQFTGDLWIENITRIRKAVHKVNPNVRLAQMTSSMAAHAAEGRRWDEYLAAMGGKHQPITRPHFGPYREATGFEFAIGLTLFRHGLAFEGRATRCCPEIENWPHSYFSKSRRQTALMLELAQFFGCQDVTFNCFALAGNDPRNEPWVVEALKQARPRMNALAALRLDRRKERGVHLWTHERAALFQKTDSMSKGMSSLCPSFDSWARVFSRVGVASTFETKGKVTAVCGDAIRAADDLEIRRLLKGGLLLDGRAAAALQEMGYGDHLGIFVKKRQVSGAAFAMPIERVMDSKFGLRGSPTMGCAQMGFGWGDCYNYITQLRGARMISQFWSGDQKPISPCVTLYENPLGGRVAVFPHDLGTGIADSVRFYNHPRKCQVQAVLRWLNRSKRIVANLDMASVVIEQTFLDGIALLAAVNLSGDPVCILSLELPSLPKANIYLLSESGKWILLRCISLTTGKLTIALPRPLEAFEVAFLRWMV
jgi:hypothetical protein